MSVFTPEMIKRNKIKLEADKMMTSVKKYLLDQYNSDYYKPVEFHGDKNQDKHREQIQTELFDHPPDFGDFENCR